MNGIGNIHPSDGLWRPGLMMCDQVTPVLHTSLSRHQIRDEFSIAGMQEALANSPTNISRFQAFKKVPESVKTYFSCLHHELDHLRRQFSNSCGFLTLHMRTKLIEVCNHLAVEEMGRRVDFPFPILEKFNNQEWLQEAISDPQLLFSRWMSQDNQRRSVLCARSLAAGIRGLEQGSRVQERILADAALFRAKGVGHFAPIGFALPPLPPTTDEEFGSYDLYEHMAALHELCTNARLGGEIDAWAELVGSNPRYRSALMLWFAYFPDSLNSDNAELRQGDLFTDVYKMYPVEFYAILDLALWIPFSPRGFRTGRRPIRWEDVQPGHRFQRSLEILKASQRPLTPVSSIDRESRFDEIQRWVADEAGWEPVSNLAEEWRAYLLTEQWYEDGLFIGSEDSPWTGLARVLLNQRAKSPFNFVCNNMKFYQNDDVRFASWITNEGEKGCQILAVDDNPGFVATKNAYLLYHGSELLLFGTKIGRHVRKLEEATRREAVLLLNDTFQCDGWDGDYFRKMAGPLFGLDG